jgi:hypothetical protein
MVNALVGVFHQYLSIVVICMHRHGDDLILQKSGKDTILSAARASWLRGTSRRELAQRETHHWQQVILDNDFSLVLRPFMNHQGERL